MSWLKYSGFFVTFSLNPFHWRLGLDWGKDELSGPKTWTCKINFLFIGMHLVVDDGSW